MRTHRFALVAAAAALGALLGGCAQQVGDIDRTQPNRIEKTAFEGEWYMLQTVVDVNATAVSTFPGLMGDLERIEFEVTENDLLARRTYEAVPAADTSGVNTVVDLGETTGAIVAWFPIRQHFDIQRSYNSATGEQSNVITENSSDRPWYERDYMRIDWTRNAVGALVDPMISSSFQNYVSVAPQDSTEDPTWIVERNDDGEVIYMDVLNTYVVETDWFECLLLQGFPNWGGSCQTETVQVRTSFMKITDETRSDHQPRYYDDYDMNRFGFFRTNRSVFDRRYGTRDDSRVSVANTWNIWERSTNDAGDVLPYAQRTPKPIVYYVNTEMPIDLLDETFEITEQWSAAFRRTVAGAQGVSIDEVPRMFYMCLNPGTTNATVPAEYLDIMRTDADRALLTAAYEASAEGYALGHCEREGVEKNVGDMRFSFINWVNNHPGAPWLGYGPSGADPLTGEIRIGGANVNGQSVDTYAQYVLDLVNIINGELDPIDLGYGRHMADYFDELQARNGGDPRFGTQDVNGDVTPDDDDQNKNLDPTQVAAIQDFAITRSEIRDRVEHAVQRQEAIDHVLSGERFQQLLANPLPEVVLNGTDGDPMRRFRDTVVEDRMRVSEVEDALGGYMRALNTHAGLGMSEDEILDWTSPVRIGSVDSLRDRWEQLQTSLLDRNIMMGADFDGYLLGFATEIAEIAAELRASGMDEWDVQEALWMEIRGSLYRAVTEHEVGHTVGLRHNFAASTDALNFFPQYWSLRSQTFDENCDGGDYETFTASGLIDGRVGRRACDGQTSAELEALSAETLDNIRNGRMPNGNRYGTIHQYQYASIMDYDAKPNTHNAGLGLYDYAAIAYGYADLIEVFEEAPYQIAVDARWNPNSDAFESIDVTRASSRVEDMDDVDDYTVRRNGVTDGDRPDDDEYDNPWTDWHYSVLPIMFYDADATLNDAPTNAATQYHELIDFTDVGAMASMYNRRLVPADQLGDGDVEVEYKFCSDYYRGSSWDCDVWDIGVDPAEIVDNIVRSYDSYYVVDMFRRQRVMFGFWPYQQMMRLYSRYMMPAKRQYQFWYLNFAGEGYQWIVSDRGGDNATGAAFDAINFLGRVVNTPTIGTYIYDPTRDIYMNIDDEADYRLPAYDTDFPNSVESDYLSLGYADGARYGFSRFRRNEEDELPYYAAVPGIAQYDIVSHFWAKWPALESLVTGDVSIAGADTSSDQSAFFLPPQLLFEDEMMNYFGSIISEDFRDIGWCVTTEDGKTEVNPIDLIRGSSTTDICDEQGGTLMNPYTAAFGNGDYNMRYFTTILAAAYMQQTLDKSWMDNSAVYVWGRGEQPGVFTPEGEEDPYEWLTYTDNNGITYAARYEAGYDPTDLSPGNVNVSYQIIQNMVDLRVEQDFWCPFEFQGNSESLMSNCGMTTDEADDFIDANDPDDFEGRTASYYDAFYELESAMEMAKFQNELGLIYNGW